jgi:hypothetical protein
MKNLTNKQIPTEAYTVMSGMSWNPTGVQLLSSYFWS